MNEKSKTQRTFSFEIPAELLNLQKNRDNFVSIEVPASTLSKEQVEQAGLVVAQKVLSEDLAQLDGGYEKLYYLLLANQFELQLLSQSIAELQEKIVKTHKNLYKVELNQVELNQDTST